MARGISGQLQRFPRIFRKDDFFTADVTLVTGNYSKLGQFRVPAGQEITFGANEAVGGVATGRQCYQRIDSTLGTEITGTVRFVLANATETKTITVMEERTERLSADTSDRNKAVLLPEYPIRAKEDSYLQIYVKVDASSNQIVDYDDADTKLLIPVTVYQE